MKRFYEFTLKPLAISKGLRSFSLLLLFILLVPLAAFSQKVKYDIDLYVECIEYVGNGKFKANFGYENKGKKAFSVEEGNRVVVYNYGQAKKNGITTFEPGRHYNVMSEEFDKNDKCEWILTLPDDSEKMKSSSVNSSQICVKESDILPYINPYSKVLELIGAELTSLANQTEIPESNNIFQISNDKTKVLIDVIAVEGQLGNLQQLLKDPVADPISAGGFGVPQSDIVHVSGNELIITVYFPIQYLEDLNAREDIVNFARPAFPAIFGNTGIITQGDAAQKSFDARNKFELSGQGIKVGVLSDSFFKGTDPDPSPGELPENIDIVGEYPYQGTDEGRAMMEIIWDVCPGCDLAFRTGFVSESDFADGILELRDADCDVIVDDITYITDPFFEGGSYEQKGLISQAIDEVVTNSNIIYVTSGGNFYDSGFESEFSTQQGSIQHDFGSGDFLQEIQLKKGDYLIGLQWDTPFYSDEPEPNGNPQGSLVDMDIYVADPNGNILFGFNRNNIGEDPIEILAFTVVTEQTTANLVIEMPENLSGNPNVRFKYIVFQSPGSLTESGFIQQYNRGNSTIFGKAANENAITVAAANHDDLVIESFSSRGSSDPNLIGANKPDITGPNRVQTSVGGLYTFFGTSAAAPHVAGVAALYLEAQRDLNQSIPDFKTIIGTEAVPIASNSPWVGGDGVIQADKILEPYIAPKPVIRDFVYEPASGEDPNGIPGQVTIILTIEAEYLSEDDIQNIKIFLGGTEGTELLNLIITGPDENGLYTVEATVPPFLGDLPLQLQNPAVSLDDIARLSDPVYFFDTQNTVIISANKNATDIDVYKKYAEKILSLIRRTWTRSVDRISILILWNLEIKIMNYSIKMIQRISH